MTLAMSDDLLPDGERLPKGYMAPEFRWWRRALMRERLPTQDEALECGLYRWGDRCVAIWLGEGTGPDRQKRAQVDGKDVWLESLVRDPKNPNYVPWLYFCQHPVSPKRFAIALKEGWPDNAAATRTIKELKSNNPPDDTSPEALLARLEEMEREARPLLDKGAAKTQDDANVAAKIADALSAIQTSITARHKLEKEPHLNEGRAVDATWFPLRDRAEELKKRIKALVLGPFLRAQEAKLYEENRKLVQQGVDPASISGITAKAVGGTRTTALRTSIDAEITDYVALWTSLQEHPQVKELIADIANRSAKAGIELPGMRIRRERRAV